MTLKDLNINKDWSLFLDRDGVINKKLDNDYVKHWMEFEFEKDVVSNFKKLNDTFETIVVVTNQQGIGKGVYTKEDLELIHNNMMYELKYYKGIIHKVYYSPHLASENNPMRKPNIGMALEAKKDFPNINFTKSIIVGDSMSDMEFGRTAGMRTVFISDKKATDPKVDIQFSSLSEFILSL
ncbi:MAG: HAD family hydrolase [Bacteroidota bacterium]|nr:HAD family hydrolase [Bacteroidota bacterium]